MMCAAFLTCWAYPDTDAFIVDQVSTALPVLDYFAPHTPRLFYCHFPDQLCDGNRKADNTLVARAPGHHNYRKVMNAIEHYGMTKASRVLCNSHFSMDVSLRTFPLIKELVSADPLYPPVTPQVTIPDTLEEPSQRVLNTVTSFTTFVSINRYERKKNIKLAIDAFHETIHRTDLKWDKPPFLIIAGGYDSKLSENKEYEAELRTYALETLKIRDDQISFLRNISAVTKEIILTHMYALIYTPENEHFGIAPVEAMLRGKPVVAVNHGGPVESVKDLLKCPEEAAGILAPPTVKDFSDAMARLVADKTLYAQLGRQGKTRAETEFSTTHCGLKLIEIVEELCSKAEVTVSKVLAEKNGTEKKEKKE
ncbi:alpha-1,3/alpha-1,6-mannosyltransferase [Angomonas deanei]|nr:alpha-1,3/alpha-1,6-mannosyltransferase [Angomonas deanei]|eukprot:EPY40922.1 alpha-1,3/alpha-1,6-mannosyltransferase [Angomonas deanei]